MTHWESWHYHVKYVPLAPVWLWFCLKARSFWFFTASNPTITFGGFEGEGKMEIYDQLPEGSYPQSIYITPGMPFDKVENLLHHHQLTFPIVVKPNVGIMGYMFRKLCSLDQLKMYHDYIPLDYIIQEWVDYPVEVSVFYYRMPDREHGKVTGFLMKQPPEISGDGRSTLKELILQNKSLQYKTEELFSRHRERLDFVFPEGEKFVLSHASNRSQGAKLVGLSQLIDDRLVAVFDKISGHSKYFYYGRYDIKCKSVESLKEHKDFIILEYNGAGAGIQHVYGNNLSLWQACSTIMKHWKMLYRISVYNHRINKVNYWDYSKGRKFLKQGMKNIKRLEKLDTGFPPM